MRTPLEEVYRLMVLIVNCRYRLTAMGSYHPGANGSRLIMVFAFWQPGLHLGQIHEVKGTLSLQPTWPDQGLGK